MPQNLPEPSGEGVQHMERSRVAARVFQTMAATAAGMTVLLSLWPSAGHDQLWLLMAAARTGSGSDPYRHVFESNPPLPAWLSQGVLGLAHAAGAPAPVILKLLVVLLAASVAAVCSRLLPRLLQGIGAAQAWWLGFCYLLMVGAVPARDFAQRDHVLVLAVMPYLLVAALPRASRPLRLAAVFLAAVGLALKPHQALIAVAVEVTILTEKRRPRLLEPAVLLLAGAAYFEAIHHWSPEFFTEVLPVLRDTYWANGSLSFPELLRQSLQLHLLAFAALAFYVTARQRPRLVTLLLVAGGASTLAFYLQDTGWYYHQLPALTLFAFALAIMMAQRVHWHVPKWATWTTAAVGLLALTLTFHFMDFEPNPLRPAGGDWLRRLVALDPPQATPDPRLFAGLSAGTPIMVLTPTVDEAVMPVELYHLTLAQRYPHFWMLPALLRGQVADVPARHRLAPARLQELVRMQQRMMVEDLDRWQPELILVERCEDPAVDCQAIGARHGNLLAFFLADAAFQERFSNFRLWKTIGPYAAYRRAKR